MKNMQIVEASIRRRIMPDQGFVIVRRYNFLCEIEMLVSLCIFSD